MMIAKNKTSSPEPFAKSKAFSTLPKWAKAANPEGKVRKYIMQAVRKMCLELSVIRKEMKKHNRTKSRINQYLLMYITRNLKSRGAASK